MIGVILDCSSLLELNLSIFIEGDDVVQSALPWMCHLLLAQFIIFIGGDGVVSDCDFFRELSVLLFNGGELYLVIGVILDATAYSS